MVKRKNQRQNLHETLKSKNAQIVFLKATYYAGEFVGGPIYYHYFECEGLNIFLISGLLLLACCSNTLYTFYEHLRLQRISS